MLHYIVSSKTKLRLLDLLWAEGESGPVAQLARLAGVSFRAAHKELNGMLQAGLASRSCVGNATVFEAAKDHPFSGPLRELLRVQRESRTGAPRTLPDDEALRSWLKAWGAPVAAGSLTVDPPPLEKVLARAAGLAHRDASVARSLPVCLWKNRSRLDLERLRVEAQRAGEKQAVGFFLEMAGTLGGAQVLTAGAQSFRDRRVRREQNFFPMAASSLEQQLARERTPKVARKWRFLMNMSLETFASTFEKFRADAEVSSR
jgi:hypothetical protein